MQRRKSRTPIPLDDWRNIPISLIDRLVSAIDYSSNPRPGLRYDTVASLKEWLPRGMAESERMGI
jgi:hypothetical protein